MATPLAILRINGNEAYSALPYWGGGYNTFGNSDGMRFTGTVSDYTVTIDKKNKVQVAFKATANTGRIYQFKMEIFYNGSTFISALCSSMDPMRYDGKNRARAIKPNRKRAVFVRVIPGSLLSWEGFLLILFCNLVVIR